MIKSFIRTALHTRGRDLSLTAGIVLALAGLSISLSAADATGDQLPGEIDRFLRAKKPAIRIEAISLLTCSDPPANDKSGVDEAIEVMGADFELKLDGIGNTRRVADRLRAVALHGNEVQGRLDLRYRLSFLDGRSRMFTVYSNERGHVVFGGKALAPVGETSWLDEVFSILRDGFFAIDRESTEGPGP